MCLVTTMNVESPAGQLTKRGGTSERLAAGTPITAPATSFGWTIADATSRAHIRDLIAPPCGQGYGPRYPAQAGEVPHRGVHPTPNAVSPASTPASSVTPCPSHRK